MNALVIGETGQAEGKPGPSDMGNCCRKHCGCLEPYMPWLFQDDVCVSADKYKTGQTIGNPAVVGSDFQTHISSAGPFPTKSKAQPPLPAPVENCTFVALFDYQARTEDDLSFQAGDKLKVMDMSQEGWWFAKLLLENGLASPGQKLEGYIPANYVAADQSIEAEP